MAEKNKEVNKLFVVSSILYKPHLGGVENSLYYLCKQLNDIGKESIIYVSNQSNGQTRTLPSFEIDGDIRIERFHLRQLPNFLFIFQPIISVLSARRGLINLKRKYPNYEICLISRSHIISVASFLAGINMSVYIIPSTIKGLSDRKRDNLTYFNELVQRISIGISIPLHHYLQKISVRNSKKVIVFSKYMKEQVVNIFSLSKEDTPCLIYPGVDQKRFYIREINQSELKEIFNLKNEFIFLCLGRVDENKGFEDVILAYSLLPINLQEKSKVFIVGDGPEIKKLNILTQKLELEHSIKFFGTTEQPEIFYNISNCFLMTSRYEAFGQTILEAMSCGLPIIAYEVDGENITTASNELISEGENGFFSRFSIEDLTDVMKRIVELHTSELEIIKKNNVEKTKKHFNWERTVSEIVNLVEN
jgi:1,2-diacylglycerol 3-alpha-glucosyltransferase